MVSPAACVCASAFNPFLSDLLKLKLVLNVYEHKHKHTHKMNSRSKSLYVPGHLFQKPAISGTFLFLHVSRPPFAHSLSICCNVSLYSACPHGCASLVVPLPPPLHSLMSVVSPLSPSRSLVPLTGGRGRRGLG